MSLIDLIMKNQIILISLGFVMIPLLVAMLLVIVPRVRRVSAAIRSNAAAHAQQQALVEEAPETAAADEAFETEAEEEDYEEEEAAEAESQPEPAAASLFGNEAHKEESDQEAGSGAGDPIQSIISSVFEDEEALEKYAILLQGTDSIDIQDLSALCGEVARQLHIQRNHGAVEGE